jgi:hypothetical protein
MSRRLEMILGILGRQIEGSAIVPPGDLHDSDKLRLEIWPRSQLGYQLLRQPSGGWRLRMDEQRELLYRFMQYHGVRGGHHADLDRILFASGCYPPLLRVFLRQLLTRVAGRGDTRPLRIGIVEIDQVRASQQWRSDAYQTLFGALEDIPLAQCVLLLFASELHFMEKTEDQVLMTKEDIGLSIDEQVDSDRLDRALGTLADRGLIVLPEHPERRIAMHVPMAASIYSLLGGDLDEAIARACKGPSQ